MKRYYLSKIKQVIDPSIGPVWKHRLQEIPNIDYVGGEIKTDPVTGIPTEKALLVLVGSIKHKTLKEDPELIALPAVAHDMKVSAVHGPTKIKCKDAMVAMGFTRAEIDNIWSGADGIRDVLEHFGKRNNPVFSCDDFDLDDGG